MRVGYLEFNDAVHKFVAGDSRQFFTREYAALTKRMQLRVCTGCTNYELPLAQRCEFFVVRTSFLSLEVAHSSLQL